MIHEAMTHAENGSAQAAKNKSLITARRGDSERWRELMLAAGRGDDRSYDVLLREIGEWLHRYYRRRLQPGVAEDAAQEVLLAIHTRRYSYVDSGPFGPWLAAIARHKWTDCLRQRSREPLPILDGDVAVEDHGAATRAAIVLEDLLSTLKSAQSSVIRLVKINGASIQEAAAATGQSPSLVKVNIHRGLKRIARQSGLAEAA